MLRVLVGGVTVLHGLVHLWYVTLSQGWVEFQPDMGWTGRSWVFANLFGKETTKWLSTTSYGAAALLFVIAGLGLLFRQDWSREWLLISSVVSMVAIILFWDGSLQLLVQKGLLGILLDIALIGLWFLWPPL